MMQAGIAWNRHALKKKVFKQFYLNFKSSSVQMPHHFSKCQVILIIISSASETSENSSTWTPTPFKPQLPVVGSTKQPKISSCSGDSQQ